MPVTQGHDARITYLWEDDGSGNHNFAGTPNDSTQKTFGYSPSLSTLEGSNNAVNQFDPNDPEIAERVAQQFSGSFTVDFTLANPWFWRSVITTASTSGAGPYTHDFDGTPPWSMQITVGDEAQSNERTLKGCVPTSCTLDVADNGQVDVSLSGAYADESHADTISTSQVSETYDPLMFADGTLTTESNTYSLVQSASVTIENNVDIIYELGSRTGVGFRFGPRSVTLDFSKIVENDTLLNQHYGGSSPTSPASRMDSDDEFSGELVFDNGKSGANQNNQSLKFTGSFPDTYAVTGTGDPSANQLEDQGLTIRDLDVEAVNDDSSAN